MDVQAQILALLHGELQEGEELTSLLKEIAQSPAGQEELLDQMKMSRHFSKLGDKTSPSALTDQGLLEKIAARSQVPQSIPVPPEAGHSGFFTGKQMALITLCSLTAFLLGIGLAELLDSDPGYVNLPVEAPVLPSAASGTDLAELTPAPLLQEVIRDTVFVRVPSAESFRSTERTIRDLVQGLYLDGVDDAVIVPEIPIKLDGSFTAAIDIKPEKARQNGAILAFVTPDESGDFLMELKDGKLRVLTYNIYNEANELVSDVDVPPNAVSEILFVQDSAAGVMQLFLDQRLIGSTELQSLSSGMKTGTLLAGAQRWYNTSQLDGYFRGSLGNIRIWNQALDPTRLGSEGGEHLIGFWPLTDLNMENHTVPDRSANGYTGITQGNVIPPGAGVHLVP